jgi:hypothetical protein
MKKEIVFPSSPHATFAKGNHKLANQAVFDTETHMYLDV